MPQSVDAPLGAGRSAAGPALRQFGWFAAIGGLAALGFVLLSGFMTALPTGWPGWVVSALCYAVFIPPVYLAHRRLAFRASTPHRVALTRYVAVQAGALGLAALFSYLCYAVLGLAGTLAAVIVIVLTSGVNFVLLRLWAFAGPGATADLDWLGAKSLLNAAHGKAVFNRRVDVLSRHLAVAIPLPGTVLDLGAGDGSIAERLMHLRPDLSVEGVDVMLRPETRIPVTLYDGTILPFADRSFDYVTIVDVLHHTQDPAAVLAEAARVARHGVVVKDHLVEGVLAAPTLRFMDWVGNRGHDVVLPYNYLSRPQWETAFAQAGLRPATNAARLGLYPAPFTHLFDRRLHFLSLLAPAGRGA